MIFRISMTSSPASSACEGECHSPSRKAYCTYNQPARTQPISFTSEHNNQIPQTNLHPKLQKNQTHTSHTHNVFRPTTTATTLPHLRPCPIRQRRRRSTSLLPYPPRPTITNTNTPHSPRSAQQPAPKPGTSPRKPTKPTASTR